MPPALLSRFDIVFTLVDKPDAIMDRLLSDGVLAVSYFLPYMTQVELIGT